jgi:hypothetical protein
MPGVEVKEALSRSVLKLAKQASLVEQAMQPA